MAQVVTYTVTIHSSQFIPFLNRSGPILKPVHLTANQFTALKNLGFDIRVIKHYPPEVKVDDVYKPVEVSKVVENVTTQREKVGLSEEQKAVVPNTTVEKVVAEEPAAPVEEVQPAVEEEAKGEEESVQEESDEIVLKTFKEYEKMSARQLATFLEEVNAKSEGHLDSLMPFAGKTKSELLSIISKAFFEEV